MKKIQVLGTEFTDYTVRETMRIIEGCLREEKNGAIGYVTTKGLLEANENPQVKEWMESLDIAVPLDVEILRAAEIDSVARTREVQENVFLREFLKKASKNHWSVFVLVDTKEQMEEISMKLLGYQGHLEIVGTYAMEELQGDEDYVINEINIAAPTILISYLPTPLRETFYENNKMKLNAKVWLMFKDGMQIGEENKNVFARVSDYVLNKIFKRKVMRFQKEIDR